MGLIMKNICETMTIIFFLTHPLIVGDVLGGSAQVSWRKSSQGTWICVNDQGLIAPSQWDEDFRNPVWGFWSSTESQFCSVQITNVLECKYSLHMYIFSFIHTYITSYMYIFIGHFLNLLSTFLFVDLLMFLFVTMVGVMFLPGFGTNVACWDGCLGVRRQLKKLLHMDEVSFRTI